ncbi:hypothetical protein Prudu_019155, partial [Prunus dulcis]
DELQKQVSEGKVSRVSFDDRLKDSLRVLLQEETKKMEAKAREEALRMEARTKQLVEAEREHFLTCLNQELAKVPKIQCLTKQAALEVMEHQEEDTAKNGKHQEDEEKEEEKRRRKEEEKEKEDEEKHDDKVIEVGDYSNMEAPSSLKTFVVMWKRHSCLRKDPAITIDKEVFGRERDTFLLPEDITQFAGMEEIGATVVAVYMRYLHDVLKKQICSMVGFIDPATVSANSGTIADRSRLVAVDFRRQTPSLGLADCKGKEGNRLFSGSSASRAGRKAVIWKTLSGTPKQPSSVECGYYVMRFMRDIIMILPWRLRISMPRETRKLHTPKKQLMKSGMNGQSLFPNY